MSRTKLILLAGAAVLGLPTISTATPMRLALSVNGSGPTIFTDTTPDLIAFTTTIGGVTFTTEVASSVVGPINTLASSSVLVKNTNAAPATIDMLVSGMNFQGPSNFVALSASGTWLLSTGSVMDATWYNDPTNVLGASAIGDHPGVQVGAFSSTPSAPITDSYAYSPGATVFSPADPGDFSMTEVWHYTLAAGGSLVSRGQTEIKTDVPEPTSLMVMGMGLTALGLVRRRRQVLD